MTELPVPTCPCGETMHYIAESESWACPKTLDAGNWGRPKLGHIHFYADEDRQAGRDPTK